MKLTRSRLQQLIKEELQVIMEQGDGAACTDQEMFEEWDPVGDHDAFEAYHKLGCNRGWGPEGEEKYAKCNILHGRIDPRALGEY